MAKLAMARSRAVIVALALLFVQLQVRDVDAWAADGHHITCLIAEVYGSRSLSLKNRLMAIWMYI